MIAALHAEAASPGIVARRAGRFNLEPEYCAVRAAAAVPPTAAASPPTVDAESAAVAPAGDDGEALATAHAHNETPRQHVLRDPTDPYGLKQFLTHRSGFHVNAARLRAGCSPVGAIKAIFPSPSTNGNITSQQNLARYRMVVRYGSARDADRQEFSLYDGDGRRCGEPGVRAAKAFLACTPLREGYVAVVEALLALVRAGTPNPVDVFGSINVVRVQSSLAHFRANAAPEHPEVARLCAEAARDLHRVLVQRATQSRNWYGEGRRFFEAASAGAPSAPKASTAAPDGTTTAPDDAPPW